MAIRELGTFDFSANFEVQKAGTIDARQLVDDFSNLLLFTNAHYITNGFTVAVKGISNILERGLYMCIDENNLNLAASWVLVGKSSLELYDDFASLPSTGQSGVLYVTEDTNYIYIWQGNVYVTCSLPKSAVGLGNVDNTSDIDKPISTLTQDALDLKLNLTAGSESQVLIANSSNVFVATDSQKSYEDNDLDQIYTQTWLDTNHDSYRLDQKSFATLNIAIKTLDWFAIIKKYNNQKFTTTIDLGTSTLWDGQKLDLTSLLGYEIIKLDTNVPTLGVTSATQADPCLITVPDSEIVYYRNDNLITIGSATGMTEINGDWMIKNVNYINKTFELYSTDGVTSLDTSAASAYGGLGVVSFTNGKFEPIIKEIDGLLDGMEITFQSVNNEDPIFEKSDKSTATINQIITQNNQDLTLLGSDTVSDQITIRRVGIYNIITDTATF